MHCWTKFATVWIATAMLPAQTPRGTTAPEGATPPPAEARAETYTESTSRDLFTSCDANSDDRLDVFEAGDAFDWLRGLKDYTGFARLDVDRDGFVGWSEFDRHFRATVQRGADFRVRTCRRLVPQAPEHQKARPATPAQQFLQLYDANRNGGLDPNEVDQIARLGAFTPAVINQLRGLDLDRSGRIEEPELAPWFEKHSILPSMPGPKLAGGSQLIPPWLTGDEDRNGTLDETELTHMLQCLDPSLGRWAPALMQRLDRNQDLHLDPEELPIPVTATAQTNSAVPAAPLPKQAPVR